MLCYMVETNEQTPQTLGYIIWSQKSGFRPEAVMELEQIAIHPKHQNKGIAQWLIRESLEQVKAELLTAGSHIKHVLVSTRADNHAQHLYRKVLGAEVEATINGLFSGDEVYMVARDIFPNESLNG